MKAQILTSIVLAMSLSISPFSAQASGSTTVQVTINHHPISFKQPPMIYHDITMLPIRDIFQELGAEIKWDPQTQTITASKNNKIIELRIGSSAAMVDYQRVHMDTPAMMVEGTAFVPLRFIIQYLGAKVDGDQTVKTINITDVEKNTNGKEESLTFHDAVIWAKEKSEILKKADQEIHRKQIMRDLAGETQNTGTDSWKGLLTADNALQLSKKNKEILADQVSLQVKQVYQSIFLVEDEMKEKQLAYQIAEMQESVALAKEEYGGISLIEKELIMKARLDAGKELQQAQTTLQDARSSLNSLIGKPKEAKVWLVDKPIYREPKKMDINLFIQQIESTSPEIWSLEKQVEMAKRNLDAFVYNNGQSRDLVKMDLEEAVEALNDGKRQLEVSIRNLYQNLLRLETQYELSKKELLEANAQLHMVKRQYEKGWVTPIEVKKAQLLALQRENDIQNLIIQLDQTQFELNPI